MKDLDTRLEEISIWIEANRDVSPQDWVEVVWPEIKSQIKQCLADEGYMPPENAKKVQEMVNSMANLANDMAQLPTVQYVKVNKAGTKALNLMTGREWFDRFERELNKELPQRFPEYFNALEAAQRASGLHNKENE